MNQKDSFSKSESQKFLENVSSLLQAQSTLSPLKENETELKSIGQYKVGSEKGILLDLDLDNGTLPFGHHSPYEFQFNDQIDQGEFTKLENFKIAFVHTSKDDFFSRLLPQFSLKQSSFLTPELFEKPTPTGSGLFVQYLLWQDVPLSKLAKLPHDFLAFPLTKEIQVLFFKEDDILKHFENISASQKMFSLLFSNVVHNPRSHFMAIAEVLAQFTREKLPEAKAYGRSLLLPLNYFNASELQMINKKLGINIAFNDGLLILFFTPTLSVKLIEETLQKIICFKDS